MVINNPCFKIKRAFLLSPAPICCAPCTEKPDAAAIHSPPNSHVLVDTIPIEVEASAPNPPTIAVSIYSIMMEVSCAGMAGMLNFQTAFSLPLRAIFLLL